MKSRSTRILLAMGLVASTTQGCGCGDHRQVIVQERQGSPVQVDTSNGVHVKAPFVDVHVPPSKQSRSGQIDVPAIDPD